MRTKAEMPKQLVVSILVIATVGGGVYWSIARKNAAKEQVKELFAECMNHIEQQEYEDKYAIVFSELWL